MDANTNFSAWYQSSQGQQFSVTIKAIAGLVIVPAAKSFFGIVVGPEWLDGFIDLCLQLGFAGWALYGYVRSKRSFERQVGALQTKVQDLGGTVE